MTERKNQPEHTFNWKGALALIVGMIAGTSVVSSINVISIFVFNTNFQYSNFYLMVVNAAGFLGAILTYDLAIARPQTGQKLGFNLSVTDLSTHLIIFPFMFGMMLIAEFITSQIPISGPFFGPFYEFFQNLMANMTADMKTLIVMAVVMAPLFEEIIFRGIIQKGLINKGMKPAAAILIASVVFGIVHGNPWQFVGAVLLGVVLGLVYHRTKSLLLPILLHAFNNLCSALLIFYGDTESFAEVFKVSEFKVLALGIVLFSVFYYLFSRKFSVKHSEK
ncbi:CPBP family intramembrane glutamic endopeptidase [Kaistella pullorum]|uniref:CPBP family intramembrane metalloprotease n=1 Tax=Kaistella pullorum TaxID=2763074 RepID=A0ABR8WNA1_9FLAO|nr:type II CAAX endopeptidase family protein [Kaistella pullorum]MBD8018427.1 CPBP family intramembrane metalloprotease [Kaistella pullorum]